MRKRLELAVVGLLLAVLAAGTTLVGVITLGDGGRPAGATATLTIFVGTATIRRAGRTAPEPGLSGAQIANGDTVSTASSSKASLRYPDGSVTRLDSSTTVTLDLGTVAGTGQVTVAQALGLTWNRVKRLAGGSSFKVTGPNSSSAEVRGTGFGYYIEHDAGGNPVIWIDVYDGIVAVSGAGGGPVATGAGQRVTVRPASSPSAPVPIPEGDKHLEFTVFNRGLEEITGVPSAFSTGALSQGQSSVTFTYLADGRSDLQFVLAAPPGSSFGFTVVAPNGNVVFDSASTSPPLVAFAARAAAGTWKYTVRDLQSPPQDPFWVVVGRS